MHAAHHAVITSAWQPSQMQCQTTLISVFSAHNRVHFELPTAPLCYQKPSISRRHHCMPVRRITACQCSALENGTSSSNQGTAEELKSTNSSIDNAPRKQDIWTDAQADLLWASVSRALLKLGKHGVIDTHVRSLAELLRSHHLVKVQLNGDPGNAQQVATELAAGADARLIGIRKNAMLFARGSMSPKQLLSAAEESASKIRQFHEKRKEARQEWLQQQEEDALRPRPGFRQQQQQRQQPQSALQQQQQRPQQLREPRAPQQQQQAPPASRRLWPQQRAVPELDEDDREATSRLGQMIQSAARPGPITRNSLRQEWAQLAESIHQEELAESGEGEERRHSREPAANAPRRSGLRLKAAWKRGT